jgi:AP-3 complex subunit mu
MYTRRLNRWTRGKTLSFVPPDGKFTLAEYRYSPTASTLASIAVTKDNVPVPFALKTLFDVESQGGMYCTLRISPAILWLLH